jgi:hypothetical protein
MEVVPPANRRFSVPIGRRGVLTPRPVARARSRLIAMGGVGDLLQDEFSAVACDRRLSLDFDWRDNWPFPRSGSAEGETTPTMSLGACRRRVPPRCRWRTRSQRGRGNWSTLAPPRLQPIIQDGSYFMVFEIRLP